MIDIQNVASTTHTNSFQNQMSLHKLESDILIKANPNPTQESNSVLSDIYTNSTSKSQSIIGQVRNKTVNQYDHMSLGQASNIMMREISKLKSSINGKMSSILELKHGETSSVDILKAQVTSEIL